MVREGLPEEGDLNGGQNTVRKEPRNIWAKATNAEAKCRCKGPEAGAFEERSVTARRHVWLRDRSEHRVVRNDVKEVARSKTTRKGALCVSFDVDEEPLEILSSTA